MPIQSFDVANAKIVHKASCDSVPKLMIIAGRNGVGKSTLLHELRKFSGDKVKGTGKILYAGPHRTWRRRKIRTTWLWAPEKIYSDILALDSIPGFEGIGVQEPQRRPDSTDEAPGFIKYILAQIETRRQKAIVSKIDQHDLKYPKGYAPDIYKPLKNMIEALLPHLHFVQVDQKNLDDVRCLLQPEGVKDPVDIDDLSSGEKEIIALFMSLIEREINIILRRIERGKEPELDTVPDTVMIIDEPDLHIHPELQKRMIQYLRERAYHDNIQFIIATHSSVITGEAESDELFTLVPEDVSGDDNQLRKVASNQEKLQLIKYLCGGDIAILTIGRPIVFIEGKDPREAGKRPSDQRILELLCDQAKGFTFIPIGGKEEVEKATTILNQIISDKFVGFPVHAIVDADLDIGTASPGIMKWEFCTIENALLDSFSIWQVLEPYKEKTGISTQEEVEAELIATCRENMQDEISRRLRKTFPPFYKHFTGNSFEELAKERDTGVEQLRHYFIDRDEVERQIQKVTREVEDMISNKAALLRFNGKAILRNFYQKRVSGKGIGMSFEVFCFSIAERICKNGRTPESIKKMLTSIQESSGML